MTGRPDVDVSVVIPCLNEEASIGACVTEAGAAIRRAGMRGEVVVVDNGSEDRSAELAEAAGARVVREPERGYGRAYLTGIGSSRGDVIFMGDADTTYDFGALPRFLARIDGGADLVMGTRLRGRIEPGAMARHRRVGGVLLTGMLNLLFRTGVSDAHCGLRMLTRSAFERMDLRSTGMEFATEMVIQAKRAGLRIEEQPITYRTRRVGSPSKLRPIPDGLRHVAFMLGQAPARLTWAMAGLLTLTGLTLLFSPGPIGGNQMAGTALASIGGVMAPAGHWLRARGRTARGDRVPGLPAWVWSRAVMAAGLLLGLAAMIGGALLANQGRELRLDPGDQRAALVATAAGVILLGSMLWAAWIRRTALPTTSA